MNNSIKIFQKETKLFFRSYFAYIILAGTSFFNALFFILFLGEGRVNYLEAIRNLFYTYHGTMMIPCLFVAMFSFSQERNDDTMELLYTSPISDLEIVLGKFLFGLFFVFINLLLLNILFPVLLAIYWNAPINEMIVGDFGLFLVGAAAITIGIFSSTLTKNPFIALIISLLIIGPLAIIGSISHIFPNPLKDFLESLSIYFHYAKFTTGVISIKDVIYYFSLIFFFLFLSLRIVESRRWR